MKLKDMIETLRIVSVVEIRNKEGYEICTCQSDSQGIEPYLECKISEWFPGAAPFKKCDFTVYVED